MTNDNLLQSTSSTKAINPCSLSKGGHVVVVRLSLLLNANWKAKRLFYNRLKWSLITLAYKYKCSLKILDVMPNGYKLKWMYKIRWLGSAGILCDQWVAVLLCGQLCFKEMRIKKRTKKSASFFTCLSETFECVQLCIKSNFTIICSLIAQSSPRR